MPQGEYLQYGGQAIIEGVMMRSPRYFSVACRAPNGDIIRQTEAIEKTWIGRQKWLKLPFLRGSLALLDSMALGIRAMRFATNIQLDPALQDPDAPVAEEVRPSVAGAVVLAVLAIALLMVGFAARLGLPFAAALPKWLEAGSLGAKAVVLAGLLSAAGAYSAFQSWRNWSPDKATAEAPKRIQDVAIGATMVLSLVLGFFIFNYLPNASAEFVKGLTGNKDQRLTSVIAEIVKLVFFLGYVGLIGLMPDIFVVFQYHGAEHKAINALEADQPLEMEACRAQTRLHPRCGTTFAFIVLLLGFIAFPFVPRYPLGENMLLPVTILVRVGLELLLLPFIAGTAYEVLRLAGRIRNAKWVNTIYQPGMWTQYLTTREPNEKQIEVALLALQACIDAEEGAEIYVGVETIPAQRPLAESPEPA